MNDRCAIAAQVVDIQNDSRHKGSIKVTLHVPAEYGARLTEALGWPTYSLPVPVALARLNESAVSMTTDAAPAPKPPAPAGAARNPLTIRAAILSKDPLFKRYLWETKNISCFDDEAAATHIREFCKVESRKDILPDTHAATRLDLLESAFICWRDKDKFIEALP